MSVHTKTNSIDLRKDNITKVVHLNKIGSKQDVKFCKPASKDHNRINLMYNVI